MLACNTLKPSLSFFPKRSKGSRFTLEVWGSRLCSPDVAQPFATVCNRPREVAMAVPVASFATVVTFGGFRRRVASFRVAGVALGRRGTLWHSNMFHNRKGRCQVPIFPRFWECSASATSCSIIYVHIPVMVLLEIHTDCQTSSGVAKGCQRMSRESWRFAGKTKQEKQT